MKFFSIVGTRPNFVKEFLVNRECRRRGIDEILVHTGQHYDYELSQAFFDAFQIPEPDYHLAVPNVNSTQFTAEVMLKLSELINREHPDFILGYGDVNSTLAAAVASTKNRVPFVHVEGGIRSADLFNPEEINRRVADVLADVIYCCTKTDFKNLENEAYATQRRLLTGDLMFDALKYTVEKHEIPIQRGDYSVLTIHRQENVLDGKKLSLIFDGLIRSGERILFPVHPRTMRQIQKNGIVKDISRSKIELVKPMGYLEFLRAMAGANRILTDSGGVRREAYLLKKPCVVLIELSWFPEISQAGWKVLAGPDPERISRLAKEFEPTGEYREIFGDGKAHMKIIDDLESRYGK